jgi:radical SAM superfamily enzyme YgiQ (UPF0313 family)
MRILLVNPSYKQDINSKYERYYIRSGSRWPHSAVKIKRTTPHYLPFPFFLAYSASLLREVNFDVYVIDAIALDISEGTLLERIRKIRPNLVFYEVTTPTVDYDLLLANKIKEISDSVIIVGGAHASFFASQIILENESIDFVLKGEYEWSLLELTKSLEEGSHNFPSGSVFRHKGEITDKGYSSPLEHLDRFPFPLRDIFPSNDNPNPTVYWDGFCQQRPAIQMQSSRGCHYRCYFCLWNQAVYNYGKYRAFSAKRVVDEIQDSISRYRAKEIYFDDDDFTTDKKHILSICEEILKRNLRIKWSCMGNVINLTEEIIGTMANSGCIGIKFGVESGSEKVLETIGKPFDLKKVKEIVKSCRKYKIKTQATFTIGLLEETEEDIKKTIRFANSLDVDSIQVSIATPFPGTEFFKITEERGFLEENNWRKYDGKVSGAIRLPELGGVKIENIRRRFFISWFLKRLLSPIWWLNHSYIISRTLKGLGISFLLSQLIGAITDERKNR